MQTFGNHFLDGKFRSLPWTQDGAPAHRSVDVRDWSIENPMRLFLWGYLKSKVYITPPQSIGDLEQRIRQEMATLKTDRGLIRRAVRDMVGEYMFVSRARAAGLKGSIPLGNKHVLF